MFGLKCAFGLACLGVLDLLILESRFVFPLPCHTFVDCYTCSTGVVVRLVMDVLICYSPIRVVFVAVTRTRKQI